MARKFFRCLSLTFLLVLWCRDALAFDLARLVTEITLPNGMKWLLVRRTQAPVFSGIVMVRVGGVDEVEGKTGLAHVFEHMAFKGSRRIGTRDYAGEKPVLDRIEKAGDELTGESRKSAPDEARLKELGEEMARLQTEADRYQVRNEVWEILVRNGAADMNAYTSKDLTAYHASMPVNRLELWASIVSDMIFDPIFREFYTERRVIAEERRAAIENNPDGAMSEELVSTAYEGGPYHWSTIGFEKDILGLTIADARKFHDRYYVPSNMVGVLVGDINPAEAKAVLSRTFGAHRGEPGRKSAINPGVARGDIVKKFAFDAEPSIAIAWHKPTLPDPVEYTFDVISSLLCEGRSSRLEKRLIYEKKIAQQISCSDSYPGSRMDNLLLIWVDPFKGHKPDEIRKEVDDEIERLSREPVGADELARVRKNVTAKMVFALEANSALAHSLAEFQTVFGDWRLLARYPGQIAKVTADDIMKAAQKYLTKSNRVVIERARSH